MVSSPAMRTQTWTSQCLLPLLASASHASPDLGASRLQWHRQTLKRTGDFCASKFGQQTWEAVVLNAVVSHLPQVAYCHLSFLMHDTLQALAYYADGSNCGVELRTSSASRTSGRCSVSPELTQFYCHLDQPSASQNDGSCKTCYSS